jgi:hypothetical protein
MKIAIMQPYFFPYLGYFSLIKHTDQFVLFDTVQHIRHGWIDRNRILKPDEGWQYIKVPIRKHSRDTDIRSIRINNDKDWKIRILGQLQHYKKKAPHYDQVKDLIEEIFSRECDSIVQLNLISLKIICNYLNINPVFQIFSGMDLDIETPNASDEWALNICKAIPDVREYWNPLGGRNLFDKSKYQSKFIELRFLEFNIEPYNQRRKVFESGLSMIDVLMFNDSDAVSVMLDNFVLT